MDLAKDKTLVEAHIHLTFLRDIVKLGHVPTAMLMKRDGWVVKLDDILDKLEGMVNEQN